jgi:sugar O-acyltransferase (sialic acid O-acetyltransferase NeuD family)
VLTYQQQQQEPAKLVIVGDGESAELACEYFTHDSPHDVVGFAVEREWRSRDELLGHPVIDLEGVDEVWAPGSHQAHVALSSTWLNRPRKRLFEAMKARGYTLASYVSSRAFVWHNVEVGENTFIFEGNVLQYHVKVGNNVVLWSGNHVGHRTRIRDHVFVSSHVVISGFCDIGESCFLGVNSCLGNDLVVGADTVIAMGCVLHKDAEGGRVYVGNPARALDKDAYESMSVPDDLR